MQLSKERNVLLMGSFIANIITAANTSSIAKNADAMARNVGAGYW